jgi:glutamine amidotransferase/cyclase
VEHFSGVFEKTKAEVALAAGIFHREEVPIVGCEGTYEGERNRDAIIIVIIN